MGYDDHQCHSLYHIMIILTLFVQNGMTPLVLCIENENIVLARELLAEAAFDQVNVKIPPKNETPAFFALRKRDMDMLKMLVEEGANVNAQNVSYNHLPED